MYYVELAVNKEKLDDAEIELIVAELSGSGFYGFLIEENMIKAYKILTDTDNINKDHQSLLTSGLLAKQHFRVNIMLEKNWNEEWEKNFSPILIDGRVLIKAPFHHIPDLEYSVTIEPKMSFGTGHHETTRLMIKSMLSEDFNAKNVLDIGCGTGILGILAKKMGAAYVMSIDVDSWAYKNCRENFRINEISLPYDIKLGDIREAEKKDFNVILANINRNILVEDMPAYASLLKINGTLIVSGILDNDRSVIIETAKLHGLSVLQCLCQNNWASIIFRK